MSIDQMRFGSAHLKERRMDVGVNVSVSHVDHAPDSDAAAVRVCMVEESE